MARQTRQQRKERRQQQLADGTARGRSRSATQTQTPVRATADAPATAEAAPRRRSTFIAESWAELQKVEWPGQRQVMQGTAVVIIACTVVGMYLWIADLLLKRFVQNVLLGQ